MQRRFGLTSGRKRGEYRVVMSNDNALGANAAAVDRARSAEPDVTGKHTPGPWKVVLDGPHVEVRAVAHPQPTLALITGGLDDVFEDGLMGPTSTANAHLIAAAPELYEALRLIVAHFGDPLKVAAAALAKAEGQ